MLNDRTKSSSERPPAHVKERLGGSGQSTEAPAHAGAADQPAEEDTGPPAALQLPRVLGDDRGRPQVPGGQEGLPVLQTGLRAQGQDVRWVRPSPEATAG